MEITSGKHGPRLSECLEHMMDQRKYLLTAQIEAALLKTEKICTQFFYVHGAMISGTSYDSKIYFLSKSQNIPEMRCSALRITDRKAYKH